MNYNEIKQAADYVRQRINIVPEIAIILGSGLGGFAERLEDTTIISYRDIPGFPVSRAKGHAGNLVSGKLNKKNLLVFSGRFHYYEGYSMTAAAIPSIIAKLLGCSVIIVTNAAGGINNCYSPGDLMLIKDHIKLCSENPLIGNNVSEFGTVFNDMTFAYSERLRKIARESASKVGISLQEGVYAYMSGPCYETPAEVKMLGILGADAVGMSTVPEVIMAINCNLEVLGISCITNMAAGITKNELSHDEVLLTGKNTNSTFVALLSNIIEMI